MIASSNATPPPHALKASETIIALRAACGRLKARQGIHLWHSRMQRLLEP